jgi:single-strand DNA-binding protein
MNTLKNSVQLVGHLGQEVKFFNFDSGSSKASFALATNDYYKNSKGEKVQDTQWHNIVAWGKLADNMKSILDKGSEVLVKGKLTSRSYDDKEGVKRYVTEIVANEFICFDKKEMPF